MRTIPSGNHMVSPPFVTLPLPSQ